MQCSCIFLFWSWFPTTETTIHTVTICNPKNIVKMNVLWTSGFRKPQFIMPLHKEASLDDFSSKVEAKHMCFPHFSIVTLNINHGISNCIVYYFTTLNFSSSLLLTYGKIDRAPLRRWKLKSIPKPNMDFQQRKGREGEWFHPPLWRWSKTERRRGVQRHLLLPLQDSGPRAPACPCAKDLLF